MTAEYDYDTYNQLSQAQQIALVFSSAVSGWLSFLGSLAITIMIAKDWKVKSRQVKFRFLLGLSLSDILNSLMFCVWSIPQPKGIIWGSFGNQRTCNLQGLLMQLGGISAIYNGALCHFFYYNICQNMKDDAYLKDTKWELYWHLLALLFPLITGILGIVLKAFNPMSFGCWYAPYPLDCPFNDNVPCIRGRRGFLYAWLFMGIPLLIMLGVIAMYMYRIHQHVKKIINRAQTHMTRLSSQTSSYLEASSLSSMTREVGNVVTSDDNNNNNNNNNRPEHSRSATNSSNNVAQPIRRSYQRLQKRKHETAVQAYLYIGIYVLTHAWNFLAYILDMIPGVTQPFATIWLAQFFWPLQGFCNLFVFLRTRVAILRQRFPTFSYWQAFWNALFHYETLIAQSASTVRDRLARQMQAGANGATTNNSQGALMTSAHLLLQSSTGNLSHSVGRIPSAALSQSTPQGDEVLTLDIHPFESASNENNDSRDIDVDVIIPSEQLSAPNATNKEEQVEPSTNDSNGIGLDEDANNKEEQMAPPIDSLNGLGLEEEGPHLEAVVNESHNDDDDNDRVWTSAQSMTRDASNN